MAIDKSGIYSDRDPGMTYKEAKQLISDEGYLYDGLPRSYKTTEMKGIMNSWWENRFLEKYLELKNNPDKFAAIKEDMRKQASGRGVPVNIQSSPSQDNTENSDNAFDDVVQKAKQAGILDELERAINKAK